MVWLALLALGTAAVALAEVRDVTVAAAMPGIGEHGVLSWREGPPYFTTGPYSSDRRFLRLETGHYAAEFDTEKIELTGFARRPGPWDAAAATRSALLAEPLSPARWQLVLQVAGTAYACAGRRPLKFDVHRLPAVPLEFPVRLIEGGRFFQKFALHDLEFVDPAGRKLPVEARLELSAWPDRLALTLILTPEKALADARAWLQVETEGGRLASLYESAESWAAGVERQATLVVAAGGEAVAPGAPPAVEVTVAAEDPEGRAVVAWSAEEQCFRVRLEAPKWEKPPEGIYPESRLDALESYAVTLRNSGDEPQAVRLGFEHLPPHSITGCVPLLLDEAGRPTGLPVQVSKNWHQVRGGAGTPSPPYVGPWLHGRTVVTVPPRSRLFLRHATAYARWGGVPSASLAQLSLVGWGHNGFWDQFALGSFGETFCFQPGRAMRRALITDFRPLLQLGFAKGERWAWTSNLGGGDTLVRFDRAGQYVPFRRNVARYTSHGPNLAQLDYEETSADAAVHSRVSVLLPRTDDCARVYLRVGYKVLRTVEFSSLALFELGADYYNDTASPRFAWGTAAGLGDEREPGRAREDLPRWEARGEQPWLSLHGQSQADRERSGQGGRGLVVREWRATLGGRPVPAPWFAAVRTRGSGNRLGAEIGIPPGLVALQAGDEVEMLLELVALPLAAERYFGPDEGLRAALVAGANTWRPVWREAAGNRPSLELAGGGMVRGVPLTLPDGEAEAGFVLRGGLGWVPVRVTGLGRPDGVELQRVTAAGRARVTQGGAERAYWQSDYDPALRRWSTTYNLPAAEAGAAYVLVPRAVPEPAPVR